jgi:hypothetical protein
MRVRYLGFRAAHAATLLTPSTPSSQYLTERQEPRLAEQVTGVEGLRARGPWHAFCPDDASRHYQRERPRCRRRRALEPLAEPHLLAEVRLDFCDVDVADGDMPVTGGPEADRPPQVVGAVR